MGEASGKKVYFFVNCPFLATIKIAQKTRIYNIVFHNFADKSFRKNFAMFIKALTFLLEAEKLSAKNDDGDFW